MGSAAQNFTRIPNMMDDDERIDAGAFRVYLHYRRVAGESGVFWAGTREVAKACRISLATVAKAKKDLEAAGYITIKPEKRASDGRIAEHIRIVDVWQENTVRYSGRTPAIPDSIAPTDTEDERDTPNEAERYYIESDAIPRTRASDTELGTTKKNPTKNTEKNPEEEPSGGAPGKPPRGKRQSRATGPPAWGEYEDKAAYLAYAFREFAILGDGVIRAKVERLVDNHREHHYKRPLDRYISTFLAEDAARAEQGGQRNGASQRHPEPDRLRPAIPDYDGPGPRFPGFTKT